MPNKMFSDAHTSTPIIKCNVYQNVYYHFSNVPINNKMLMAWRGHFWTYGKVVTIKSVQA